jgi:hypothetical protein
MDDNILKLLELSHALRICLDKGDLKDCTGLLEERGQLLRELAARFDPANGRSPPPELQPALVVIRDLDQALEAQLAAGIRATGQELARLGPTRKRDAEPASRCLDRQA